MCGIDGARHARATIINDFVTDCKTICVRSTPHANSPSPELALEIAPLIHPGSHGFPFSVSCFRCLCQSYSTISLCYYPSFLSNQVWFLRKNSKQSLLKSRATSYYSFLASQWEKGMHNPPSPHHIYRPTPPIMLSCYAPVVTRAFSIICFTLMTNLSLNGVVPTPR
jgi:hypothetical protein